MSVTVQSSGGLSKDQIENMLKDAEKYAEEDKKRKELIGTFKYPLGIVGQPPRPKSIPDKLSVIIDLKDYFRGTKPCRSNNSRY